MMNWNWKKAFGRFGLWLALALLIDFMNGLPVALAAPPPPGAWQGVPPLPSGFGWDGEVSGVYGGAGPGAFRYPGWNLTVEHEFSIFSRLPNPAALPPGWRWPDGEWTPAFVRYSDGTWGWNVPAQRTWVRFTEQDAVLERFRYEVPWERQLYGEGVSSTPGYYPRQTYRGYPFSNMPPQVPRPGGGAKPWEW